MSNYKKQQKFYSKHEFKNCPEVYGKNIEIINCILHIIILLNKILMYLTLI